MSGDMVQQAALRVAEQARGHRPGSPVTEPEREAVRSWLRALSAQQQATPANDKEPRP